MDIAELSRRLENLIRIGTVAEVDLAARRVRVDTGSLLTDWLKWKTARAGTTRTWSPPTVGEQVMILSPSGELANGIVTPSIFCDDLDAPSGDGDLHVAEFPDGARIAYDHAGGALTATGIQTALIQAAVSVTLDTPSTHCTGDLHVDGDVQVDGTATVDDLLTYGNGIAGTGGANNNVITGSLTQTSGTLSSNGIVLDSHHHTGVQPGSGNTGGPA
ncbi:MAG: phage baseplate assembly protein V [Sterolibacterium sp.]|nr:phage baseplate assembly protein V [Sterolibacterium sp.]